MEGPNRDSLNCPLMEVQAVLEIVFVGDRSGCPIRGTPEKLENGAGNHVRIHEHDEADDARQEDAVT